MRRLPTLCVLACAAAAATVAQAQPGHRQLGAHEHGFGTLNVAVDGNRVAMELEVPGADIVGFEHTATTTQQKSQLESAKKRLADGLALFQFPSEAGCELDDSNVDYVTEVHGGAHSEEKVAQSDAEHEHGHAHGDHTDGSDHHAHEEGHSGSHDDHGHEHGQSEGGHAEFHATYTIECTSPAALTGIVFEYFRTFENAERLEVNLVTDSGQSSQEATRAKPEIRFQP